MQALVTGGGGFLGFEVVKQLKETGYTVRSFSRQNYPQLENIGVKSITGDLVDYKAVKRVVQGIDIVFHVAAKAGVWGKREDYYSTNVLGTKNVVKACLDCKVKYLIYTSSPSVTFSGHAQLGVTEDIPYAKKNFCYYQETKKIAEEYVLQNRTPKLYTVALRPHLIWGERDPHLIPRLIAKAKRFRFIGNGKNLIDTTYIANAAAAHVCAAQALLVDKSLSGNRYFITNDEPVTIEFFINAVLQAYGMQPIMKKIPRRLGILLGHVCEYVYLLAGAKKEPPLTRFTARQLSEPHWYDISRAKKELRYQPKISLAQGLKNIKDKGTSSP